jgi:BirA family biotin operon repressor/biotin-[acetyl-CoA-carboxylase] ligase
LRDRLDRLADLLTEQVENVVLLNVVDSTHAMARRLIAAMDEEEQALAATVIIADHQECGEGRGGRRWESPPGGLYVSWMRSGIDSETIARLPMLAAAAAAAAVRTVGVEDARIKWPNDLLVAGKKLAGMVVFARHGDTNWATVGLGINIDTTPILDEGNAPQATSIADLKKDSDIGALRDTLVSSFVGSLTRSLTDPEPALASWRGQLLQQPGDTVKVRLASAREIEGTVIEVTEEGFLRIGVNGDEQVITGGDLIES